MFKYQFYKNALWTSAGTEMLFYHQGIKASGKLHSLKEEDILDVQEWKVSSWGQM